MSDIHAGMMLKPVVATLACDECGRKVTVREDDTLLGAERGKFFCCGWCEKKHGEQGSRWR